MRRAIEGLSAPPPCDMMGLPVLAEEVMASTEGWHMSNRRERKHCHGHAFAHLMPLEREGLVVASRRNMLKASLAGLAGLSLPGLLRRRASAAEAGQPVRGARPSSCSGWPVVPATSTPGTPSPIARSRTAVPSASSPPGCPACFFASTCRSRRRMLDRFTIIRSVDARHSNHEPNKVFQTANLEAEPRLNPSGEMYPAIGSVVAKHHGANQSGLPPYVAFQTSRTHVAYGGYLGQQYDPFIANRAAKLPIYNERRRGHRPHVPRRASSGCRRA